MHSQPISIILLAATLLMALSASPAGADEQVPVRIRSALTMPLVDTPPVLDGNLSDPAWEKAQPMRITAYQNKGARYPTDAWICRDEKSFYIAARCHDDNLGALVTEHEGGLLWKNDCLEIFFVPEKNEFYWTKVIVDCEGKYVGTTWVPDEWGEAVAGPPLVIEARPGREEEAWTLEVAVPIGAFGLTLSEDRPWAFGINREKASPPVEVSSYQGGFNKPAEYPDLFFDNRSVVFDGMGVKNIGDTTTACTLTVAAGPPSSAGFSEAQRRPTASEKPGLLTETKANLAPGQGMAVDWKKMAADLKEEDTFTVTVKVHGQPPMSETYRMAPAPKKMVRIDPDNLPEPNFRPGPLDDPNFFPIAVWLQPAAESIVKAYQEIGVNVYVGGIDSYPRPRDKEWLDVLQAHGIYAIIKYDQKYVDNELYKHPNVIGWHQPDEPDLPQAGGDTIPPEAVMADFLAMRGLEVQLPVYLGLSMCVANDRSPMHVLPYDIYPDYCAAGDWLSYDIYPCNSLGKTGPDRFCVVGKGLDRLNTWSGGKKKLGFAIECNKFTKPNEKDSRSPTPEEVKSQMWIALVHGARMINLFCHSWAGPKMKVAGIEPEMMQALKGMIDEIRPLAPVLNSPTIENGAEVENTMGSRVDTLVKKYEGDTYVFAVNMYRKPEKPAIRVAGAKDGTATVLYEDRTVPVKNGVIVDNFAPYAVHRYQLQ